MINPGNTVLLSRIAERHGVSKNVALSAALFLSKKGEFPRSMVGKELVHPDAESRLDGFLPMVVEARDIFHDPKAPLELAYQLPKLREQHPLFPIAGWPLPSILELTGLADMRIRRALASGGRYRGQGVTGDFPQQHALNWIASRSAFFDPEAGDLEAVLDWAKRVRYADPTHVALPIIAEKLGVVPKVIQRFLAQNYPDTLDQVAYRGPGPRGTTMVRVDVASRLMSLRRLYPVEGKPKSVEEESPLSHQRFLLMVKSLQRAGVIEPLYVSSIPFLTSDDAEAVRVHLEIHRFLSQKRPTISHEEVARLPKGIGVSPRQLYECIVERGDRFPFESISGGPSAPLLGRGGLERVKSWALPMMLSVSAVPMRIDTSSGNISYKTELEGIFSHYLDFTLVPPDGVMIRDGQVRAAMNEIMQKHLLRLHPKRDAGYIGSPIIAPGRNTARFLLLGKRVKPEQKERALKAARDCLDELSVRFPQYRFELNPDIMVHALPPSGRPTRHTRPGRGK